MNSKFALSLLAAVALASGLSACGGTNGGRTITDGSGNPVQIGSQPNASSGPGSPGWPEVPAVSGR
jgi:hypothetical protein